MKACTSATFEANPADCPPASRVGSVTAITPVLPVTLTGPAYFVSYGGAKFPELVFALQGYGVTIYDASNPAKASLITSIVCPGGQGDVSVYGNLLFMSVEGGGRDD